LRNPEPSWKLDKTVAQGGQILFSRIIGDDVYHYTFPLRFSGIDWGVLYLGLSLKNYQAQMNKILTTGGHPSGGLVSLNLTAGDDPAGGTRQDILIPARRGIFFNLFKNLQILLRYFNEAFSSDA
jgi:hypothetical protein